MTRRFVHIICSLSLAGQLAIPAFAADQPELNFKVYNPDSATPATTDAASDSKGASSTDSVWSTDSSSGTAAETPKSDPSADLRGMDTTPTTATTPDATKTDASSATETTVETTTSAASKTEKKLLQGYIRVVPSGTKIPIIMDTAIDTDTSQEGDEFAARTSEDLNIDGSTVVPAGSVIKGRIAQLNAPKNLDRAGSVALKFDTVTTPDNRQIPLVANLVARGGVVHARRGLKDIAMDTGTVALPLAVGLAIGALAGNSSSSSSSGSGNSKISKGEAAMIGAGIGAAVGIIILCIKKGKKVDVRPGDELKIELAEDLRMPM